MASIYIVTGSTGEYDGRCEWAVVAYHDRRKAKRHADRAAAKAKAIFESYPDDTRPSDQGRVVRYGVDVKRGDNPHDPNMRMDYNGTTYYIRSVHIGDSI